MNKFSAGCTVPEVFRDLMKAVNACFNSKLDNSTREVYLCLKMMDKILPQNLPKMMKNVLGKHLKPKRPSESQKEIKERYKEVAALKCILDFRIAYY